VSEPEHFVLWEQIRQKQLERDETKLGERWRTLREKKRIEASIHAREGARPALPAPPASPPLVHPLLGRALALGRLLAAEGRDAAMRAIERGELHEPAEQSPDQLSKVQVDLCAHRAHVRGESRVSHR
jgi:hypothetical protein